MQIGICPAKETMPNGISSDKTDSAGINYAAILIIRKADFRRQSRQAEAENLAALLGSDKDRRLLRPHVLELNKIERIWKFPIPISTQATRDG